jgi:hypothetical protein
MRKSQRSGPQDAAEGEAGKGGGRTGQATSHISPPSTRRAFFFFVPSGAVYRDDVAFHL